jgi:hypothetical protein
MAYRKEALLKAYLGIQEIRDCAKSVRFGPLGFASLWSSVVVVSRLQDLVPIERDANVTTEG